MSLPLADSAAIVRSHQKDSYYETYLHSLLSDAVKSVRGTRLAMKKNELLLALAKIAYLGLTTLAGARTLGEEYVDLVYTDPQNRLAGFSQKMGFVLGYGAVPYLISQVLGLLRKNHDLDQETILEKGLAGLNKLWELNLAIFYLFGNYYNLSKRIFGLRYLYGHGVSAEEQKHQKRMSLGYRVLGSLMLMKFAGSVLGFGADQLNAYLIKLEKKTEKHAKQTGKNVIYNVRSARNDGESIELSDLRKLPYMSSRSCMLCLETMKDPACLGCGHVGCYGCIMDWLSEHNDCPMCRRAVENQVVLLK